MRSAPVLDTDKTPEFGGGVEATHAPVGIVRRVGAFLLRELREMLPPTIFFFIGFNLILLTTNLLVANYGAAFGSFMLVTGGALVVGKAVLIANATQSIRRYNRAPLIRPILFKSRGQIGQMRFGLLSSPIIRCCPPARVAASVNASRL